jgi:hypothetical protein
MTDTPPRSWRHILAATCEGTGVTPADVLGYRKYARFVEVRHRAIRAVKAELNWSTNKLGRAFGDRDHTTIMYALRQSDKRLDSLAALPVALRPAPPPPPIIHAPMVRRPDNDTSDDLTPMQISCLRSASWLAFIHGPNCYAARNVRPEREQLRAPPWEM